MPLTPEGVYYADTSTSMSVADITAEMATSISTELAKLSNAGIVNSEAARDTLYPTPIQGNNVFRSDLGLTQTYYEAYNSTTNPGGKTPAGWVSERRIFVQSTTPASPNVGDLWFW